MYCSGLERLCGILRGQEPGVLNPDLLLRIRRAAGLLTHPAAVTSDLTHAVDALREAGAGLRALLGPEHGARGDAPDGHPVADAVDARTGLPIYSLYGGGADTTRKPDPGMLRGLEALIIDLQDVGTRFYTFASTVSHCMDAAAAADLPVVLLDRLNPIGHTIEGPLLRPEFTSFVGLHPLPVRHGCSMAELALLFHRQFGVGHSPTILPYLLTDRTAVREAPERLLRGWVPPSPNIPTPLTALIYPGTCLLEGTNLSEGRGTTRPFEWLGAPWIDAAALAERLQRCSLPGAKFRPTYFVPTASKWAGERCGGVHLHVTDVRAFRPVLTGVAILFAVRALWPERLAWLESRGRYSVDLLAGTDGLRLAIDRGEPPETIAAGWKEDEAAFHVTRAAVRLYS
jgi:uncharacterized protein YbbC (DUF1343 family)